MPVVIPVGKPVPLTRTCMGFVGDTSIDVTVAIGALNANLQLPGAKQVDSLEAASVTTTSLSSLMSVAARPVLRMRHVI
jgi:hypothetical protein